MPSGPQEANESHCHSLWEVASYFLKKRPYSRDEHLQWIIVMLAEADYLYIPAYGKAVDPNANTFAFEEVCAGEMGVALPTGPIDVPQYFRDMGYPVSASSPILIISGQDRYPIDLVKVHFPDSWYHTRYVKHFETAPFDEIAELKKTQEEFNSNPFYKDRNPGKKAFVNQLLEERADMVKLQQIVNDHVKPSET